MFARLAAVAGFLVMALAGCSDAPGTDSLLDDAPVTSANELGTTALAAAPQWAVGQSWDHHWYFGPQDTQGFVVKAIVVENSSAGYRLATDEPSDAASHASFYFHDQGLMSTADWTVRDADGAFAFPWYNFPLEDGKTWRGREENLDFNLERVSRDLTMTATAINGTPGAFSVEARDGQGLRARYDYQPSIGWFSEYLAFDPAGNGTQWQVRMVNEGQGKGWTGTYYTAKADFLLNTITVVAPTSPAPPPPPSTFTITDAHTHVLAVPFVFAAAGASAAELTAPDGQHWEAYMVADQGGAALAAAQPNLVFVPAVAGDWHFATAGAGAFVAGGGCFAFGVTLASGTL